MISIILCSLIGFSAVSGLSTGPPLGVCGSMNPQGHIDSGFTAQNLSFSATASPLGSGQFLITVSGPQDFKGVFIQVRDSVDEAVGTFSAEGLADFQTPPCFRRIGSAFSHANGNNKGRSVTASWTAPSPCIGLLTIRATVVVNFVTFQVGITEPLPCPVPTTEEPPPAPPVSTEEPPLAPSTVAVEPPLPGTTLPPPPPPHPTTTSEEAPPTPEPTTIEELPPTPEPTTIEEAPPTPEPTTIEELPPTPEPTTIEEPPQTPEPTTIEELPQTPEPTTIEELPQTPEPTTIEELPQTPEPTTIEEPPPPATSEPTALPFTVETTEMPRILPMMPGGMGCRYAARTSVPPNKYSSSFESKMWGGWKMAGQKNYRNIFAHFGWMPHRRFRFPMTPMWMQMKGPTPSNGTGPQSAADGMYYMYLEASKPMGQGDRVSLHTDRDLRGCFCLQFYHHHNVHLFAKPYNQHKLSVFSWFKKEMTRRVMPHNSWRKVSVQFDEKFYTMVRIVGTRGKDWRGDMAIDNVSITEGKCPS